MIKPNDLRRAVLARKYYDPTLTPRWPIGSASLPRCFLDVDEDGSPVVVYEGSRPILEHPGDWITDFDQTDLTIDPTCEPVPAGWGRCVLATIFRIARDVPPTTALGFDGHSMGASDALIAARQWKLMGRPLGRVTAFEPGPVGKLDGALLDEDILITRLGDDFVPIATSRGHPYAVTALPNLAGWSIAACHDIENVESSLARVLAEQSSGTTPTTAR